MIQEPFFWAFLGLSVALFWTFPLQYRLHLLSLVSIVFIGCYDFISLACLIVTSVLLFFALPTIARRNRLARGYLLGGILLLITPLVALKLGRSVPELQNSPASWAVPLGMSYYVFRLIHLMVDTYRTGRYPKSAADYHSYVFMFTIFIAGPIQRYEPFHEERELEFHSGLLAEGFMRIVTGLIKQGVFYYALFRWRDTFSQDTPLPSLDIASQWLYLLIAYIASYINLSAYTDIAIGASRLFGFRIMENFSFPILATSIDDFWRRWHISLSSWCQAYVYAPVLGALRNPYIAVIASFQVMGLWHTMTMNRVAWGLFHAAGFIAVISIRRWTGRKRDKATVNLFAAAAGWIITQAFITLSFVFVVNENSNDVLSSMEIILRMVTLGVFT